MSYEQIAREAAEKIKHDWSQVVSQGEFRFNTDEASKIILAAIEKAIQANNVAACEAYIAAQPQRSNEQIGSASNRKWGKSECFVCGKFISTCGLGYVSHMRTHVNQGKLEETWSADGKRKEFNWTGIWKP